MMVVSRRRLLAMLGFGMVVNLAKSDFNSEGDVNRNVITLAVMQAAALNVHYPGH